MKNIFRLGLIATIMTGCVTVNNVNPSPTPVTTATPQVTASPTVLPTPNPTPVSNPTPYPTPRSFSSSIYVDYVAIMSILILFIVFGY